MKYFQFFFNFFLNFLSAIYFYLCISHYTTTDLKVAFFPSFFLLRILKLWRIGASSAESWEVSDSRLNRYEPILPYKLLGCRVSGPAWPACCLLSSGYLRVRDSSWNENKLRTGQDASAGLESPSAAPCALFWVHSAYPWQVMPAADKRPPLPVRLSRLRTWSLDPGWHRDIYPNKFFFFKRNCSAAGIERLKRSI